MSDLEPSTPEEREQRLQVQSLRAAQAKQIIENPLVVEYFEHLGATLYKQFRETELGDTDRLEWLRMLDQANQNFEAHFRATIVQGIQADHDLELLKKKKAISNRRT